MGRRGQVARAQRNHPERAAGRQPRESCEAQMKSTVKLAREDIRLLDDFRGHHRVIAQPMNRRLKRIMEASAFMEKHALGRVAWGGAVTGKKKTPPFAFLPSSRGVTLIAALRAKRIVEVDGPPAHALASALEPAVQAS